MTDSPAAKFLPRIASMSDAEISRECDKPAALFIDGVDHRGHRIETAYAPFDHVNTRARIVLVGMTPGKRQMKDALMAARSALRTGAGEVAALEAAKVYASFSGDMRDNLVEMLDELGLNRLLGIASAGSLWGRDAHLAHFTSMLRYPTFVDGENYSGSPAPKSCPFLKAHVDAWLGDELAATPEAIVVPLGPVVGDTVARIRGLNQDRVIPGLPHPSKANRERIAFFLRRKPREKLSKKCDPDKLIAARLAAEAAIRSASASRASSAS